MITRETVLILGAGASIPFGFPSGYRLLQEICRKPDAILYRKKFKVLEFCGFAQSQIDEFRTKLARSGHTSVDAFLEHRTEYIDVGKAAIAAVLIPYERTENLFEDMSENNWYQYLWGCLNVPVEEFESNRLSIVTFNYDRSLEQYLFTVLKNSYDLTDQAAAAKLNNIPIIHVHGRLGHLEWQPLHSLPVPYDSRSTQELIAMASKNIKIIHEDITEDKEFNEAHKLIESAKKIVFLGFGYNRTNLERLGVGNVTLLPLRQPTRFYERI